MIYIGKRCTDNLDDGYIGCGIQRQDHATLDTYFHNAVRKYGYENFKREIIEFCEDREQLNPREIFWIKELNTHYTFGGYNMTWGGDGGADGFSKGHIPWNKGLTKETDERVKKYTEKKEGKKHSKEWNQNCSKSHLGKKQSKETVESRSKSMIGKNVGKVRTLEMKQHLRELNIGKKKQEQSIEKQKESYQKRSLEICEFCGYESRNSSVMKRLHGDNCKHKQKVA